MRTLFDSVNGGALHRKTCSIFVRRVHHKRPGTRKIRDFGSVEDGVAQQVGPQARTLVFLVDAHHAQQYCGHLVENVAHEPTALGARGF